MTTIVMTGLRMTVAAVFAVAGLAKLRAPDPSRAAIAAAGVPRWARDGVTRVLPFVELGVAASLLLSSGRPPRLGAVALITVFNIGVGIAIVRGTTDTCGCFGRAAVRLGWPTVARNSAVACASVVLYLAA
jgi:hypothetical protein